MPDYDPQRSRSRPSPDEGPAPVDALLGNGSKEAAGNGDPRPIGGDRLVVDLDDPAPAGRGSTGRAAAIVAAVAAVVVLLALMIRKRRSDGTED